jgi:hypothetical protein
MATPSWVTLQTFTTGLEADAARLTLEDAGIPVLVPGQQVGIFGPGYRGGQPGGITMLVPDVALLHARELLGLDSEEAG